MLTPLQALHAVHMCYPHHTVIPLPADSQIDPDDAYTFTLKKSEAEITSVYINPVTGIITEEDDLTGMLNSDYLPYDRPI